jgi:predicted amidohydrolase
MGVLICADSHNSLMPRVMALKGANFLWVPANWPPTSGLDPKDIWRARALENGVFLAACNRTGKDRVMDCSQAASYVFDPQGRQLFSGSSETSQVFFVDIPLDEKGRLTDTHRRKMLNARNVHQYRPVYLEPWVEDLTQFYKLPKPGILDLHCFIPTSNQISLRELVGHIENTPTSTDPALWILPEAPASHLKTEDLAKIARDRGLAFAVSLKGADGQPVRMLVTPDGIQHFYDSAAAEKDAFPFKIVHYGPAAIAMVAQEDFRHPELAVALSKLGCDLVVLSEGRMSPEDLLVSRVKSLTGVAVAACAENGAEITCMQDLHGACDKRQQYQPGVCSYGLNTSKTRKKHFQSGIDFDLLLKNQ